MSSEPKDGGFSTEWLRLREAYDHASRSPRVLAQLREWSLTQSQLQVVDLGAGRGSTYRAVARHLQCANRWRLVDHDPALLADMADMPVETQVADLQADLEAVTADADLIVASALIDLVSEAWLQRLVALNKPLYLALSFDGRVEWLPHDPDDDEITALFCAHQGTEKGFGPALGPKSGERLAAMTAGRGQFWSAQSDWRFGGDDRAIQHELTSGFAMAAHQMAVLDDADYRSRSARIDGWAQRRQAWIDQGVGQLLIGHTDELWLPA